LPVIKPFWQLVKPGIIAGNLITLSGGFFLASKGQPDLRLLLITALGVALIIACGCVMNNVIDRDIDALMQRTQQRIMAQQELTPQFAMLLACVLGLTGASLLYLFTNSLVIGLSIFALLIYVGLYSLMMKRHSVHSTLVGSLAGAIPPVAGYCAVTQQFDLGALIVMLLFCLWQMPHSYAIAVYRLNDYTKAAVPVLPVKNGVKVTKHQTVFYVLAFVMTIPLLTLTGYTGWLFLVVMLVTGLYWLAISWLGYRAADDQHWAKRVFLWSISTVMLLSAMMSLDAIA
jgi:protoheme IX farnesyltransferase